LEKIMTTTAVAAPTFSYYKVIGNQSGPPRPGFTAPIDVALGPGGLLYVLSSYYEYDAKAKFVVKCNFEEDYLAAFGAKGTGDDEFTWPNSLAVDRAGNVYVTDEWLNRITIFSPQGKPAGKWGALGSKNGQWNRPAGMVFDVDDNLLVADSLNHRIQKFTRDGQYLAKFGKFGAEPGQLNMPWGITLDRQGNIYVADWRNDRIQKFSPEGRFLLAVGHTGQGDGEFRRPADVAVDADGFIYATDWSNDRVQVFDSQGRFVTKFLGDCPGYSKWAVDRMASNPENMKEQRELVKDFTQERIFFQPTGILVDDQYRIVVTDTGRHRLQIYQKRGR
jgi:DNA-binding beta-propeller fold protein YncE